MAIYFLLGTLTTKGQRRLSEDPDHLHRQPQNSTQIPEARILGHYPVLGHYDLITMVEAEDNAAVARLSSALGSAAGLRIETLTGVTTHPESIPALVPAATSPQPAVTVQPKA